MSVNHAHQSHFERIIKVRKSIDMFVPNTYSSFMSSIVLVPQYVDDGYNRATNYKIPPYHDIQGVKEGRDRAKKIYRVMKKKREKSK